MCFDSKSDLIALRIRNVPAIPSLEELPLRPVGSLVVAVILSFTVAAVRSYDCGIERWPVKTATDSDAYLDSVIDLANRLAYLLPVVRILKVTLRFVTPLAATVLHGR